MKFSVLALDFDGTIARDDVLEPEVRSAIGELRARNIVVVLVTGRTLADLRRLLGDLHLVDAVVAENGAVLEFPDSGYAAALGKAPPEALLRALTERGLAFNVGQCVVDANAADAEKILLAIRALELPLVLVFNRSRVMVLPQAISKATGLRRALDILRLSPRNAVAIGDAENDHELLQVCELGVAVAWGSSALKASADFVLDGEGPAAVARYIRQLAGTQRIPATKVSRRRLLLGHTDTGAPLSLAVRGRNLLIAGDPKSGKSWAAGLLCEQLILLGYCLFVLDPEGDYTSLEALPGVVVLGGADPLPTPRDLLRALRHPDVSVVVDLSHTPHDAKLDYLWSVLPGLATLRQHTGLPHRIIVDEAHYFLHDADVLKLIDLSLNGYTLVTYRASQLHPAILAASEAVVVTRESDPHEVQALLGLCGDCALGTSTAAWTQSLGLLTLGEAIVLPITEESQGAALRVRLAPRLTPHVRHLTKYVDIPVPQARAFVFWRDGRAYGPRVRTLKDFVDALERSPKPDIEGHLRRGDTSRWVAEVFGDHPLARALRGIEEDARNDKTAEAAERVVRAIRERYEFLEPIQ